MEKKTGERCRGACGGADVAEEREKTHLFSSLEEEEKGYKKEPMRLLFFFLYCTSSAFYSFSLSISISRRKTKEPY